MRSVTFYCVDVVNLDTGEVLREYTGYSFSQAMKRLERSKVNDVWLKGLGVNTRWAHRFYEKTYIGRNVQEIFYGTLKGNDIYGI